ncbi:MAG: biotin--[acetyl-CoA-carboxylase] ligase [Fimbriimonas sp.]|jgi:biotin-[acetyl-CoA-carboxylase] ligase BirA-like protein|nr:biotin--[acetyl-CoA-carboxylase] ligase [Fimbriimonas sp.]
MKPPAGPTIYLREVSSTQDLIKSSEAGVVWTDNQTAGRGRHDRIWYCAPGTALAASFRFDEFTHHQSPYLVGMGLAVIVANEFDLNVQWPNDIVSDGRKIGGILTEVTDGVPIVGLGLNLTTGEFPPEIRHRATSLHLAKGEIVAPQIALKRILVALSSSLLCVDTWTNLAPEWQNRDATRGKTYSLPDGRTVVAQHITEEGHLFWMSETDSGITTLAEASYS